jgi:phage terminase large subunit
MIGSDLVKKMKILKCDPQVPIPVDPSRPELIEELKRSRFNAISADNDLLDGIDYVRDFELIIDPAAYQVITELRNYCLRPGPNGKPTSKPVDEFNHALDALRYGLYTLRRRSDGQYKRITAKDLIRRPAIPGAEIDRPQVWEDDIYG